LYDSLFTGPILSHFYNFAFLFFFILHQIRNMKLSHYSGITSIIVFYIISGGIIACGNQEGNTETVNDSAGKPAVVSSTPSLLVFDKLVGTWQNENGRDFEKWTKNEDGTFHSVVFSVKGTDTSWSEEANIYPEKDKWIFENTVKGQNDGKSTKFISILLNETTVQFSNPAHNFPTDVNYTVPDPYTVNAFIVGPDGKGGKDTIPFNYKKAGNKL
jgi:hypothetical protein